ncbi:Exoglucanase 1 [Podospora fimiseda]|uniref:Glucanase n=1 Tax=Podospora fimiseda TaxID=252190 RepID=A0AAN7BHG9_9PEZI|nr:Exoglucanase 1 [Podospora fimiseda]
MFLISSLLFPVLLGTATAQGFGNHNNEIHPKLQWTSCSQPNNCQQVNGEVVLDANWRWLHTKNGYTNCYDGNKWTWACNSTANCTEKCVYDGVNYSGDHGIKTSSDSLSQRLRIPYGFDWSVGSRLFLMENKTMYKTFTLLNNELAFDVYLPTLECGINGALYFIAMDADGGVSKFPGNTAGAEYGVGYCDASCPRNGKFVGGKANYDGWVPSRDDPVNGQGKLAACCPEFDVWNSNAHSYSMSSKVCPSGKNKFVVCTEGDYCDPRLSPSDERPGPKCDPVGCSWSTYRLASKEFYGRGKLVDTNKKFTVVTRWEENRVYQFFIQDGKKIEVPTARWDDLPKENGISPDMCAKLPDIFSERDRFMENDGWKSHLEMVTQPMVMAMSLNVDYWSYNLWLDSVYPPERENTPEMEYYEHGPCRDWEKSNPRVVLAEYPYANVTWSNIRFGPIGSTMQI